MVDCIDLPHARAALAHRIAGCVHTMLAIRHMTAEELKEKLRQLPAPRCQPEAVDAVLNAADSDKVTIIDLADIAFALGFEWDFHVRAYPEPETAAAPPDRPDPLFPPAKP